MKPVPFARLITWLRRLRRPRVVTAKARSEYLAAARDRYHEDNGYGPGCFGGEVR